MSIRYRKHDVYTETILIRDFVGEVGVNEIIDSWENIIGNDLIKPGIVGVINNLIGCELVMTPSSFNTLIRYLKSKSVLSKVKLAVVCDRPKDIVFPILGENSVTDLKIRPFSSLEAAEIWILKI